MKRLVTLAALAALLAPAGTHADQASGAAANDALLRIARAGSQPSERGPARHFAGAVRVDPLFAAESPSRMFGGSVTFEPGARSAWHTHPVGQVLIVTAGVGRVQREGDPVEEIRPGDVVRIAPGVKHWHGAATGTGITHIALQEHADGRAVDWMELVGDAQPGRGPRRPIHGSAAASTTAPPGRVPPDRA